MPKKLPARFTDEAAARKHLEAIQWPDGKPICPHCNAMERASRIKGGRDGLLFCNACRKQYSVTVGTVFERSKVPLYTWLYANHLLCSSKKGISSLQLSRMLGVTYKTAWFMTHRIREAMTPSALGQKMNPMGGNGKVVEADETYIGRKKGRTAPKGGSGHKHAVVALVERGGEVRSFYTPMLRQRDMRKVLHTHVAPDTKLRTDESTLYFGEKNYFASHETVNHGKEEYVRGDASTNVAEGVFSIFKRGMVGTYQHCGEQHLQRYLSEFDFRYNNRIKLGITDDMRADKALEGIGGKRLTYRRINERRVVS